jgi:hypothetical protein
LRSSPAAPEGSDGDQQPARRDAGVKVAVGYSHGADTAKAFAAAHEGATIHQGNIGVAADCERVIARCWSSTGRWTSWSTTPASPSTARSAR